ncbi:fimbrial isopeptide formation D2 family protein/LPXTG-motif cell wall-anchored protein [Phycicoccus badiiscoriae]|uniref:Fimbrial isopeptide formation D2 family protein/LPXTG-motif cell wall-anchored protein n=1 Tax=Pedococcus badiiscoriae TaxID=642776 RepID=A0A852WM20_9MICO|nr:SpaH/EbpB family LPXTG-anchored major pilin [Pedococcus badiiscoriae]NYG07275.1 fimbrial isopeptide formation D2 family protein/LPXTG-motif cell wall-anchored protein [Pedococcus badiiscoriae]
MNNTSRSPRLRRLAAVVGAGALTLLGVAAIAGPANADTTGGNVPAGPYNLTITKLQNPTTGGTATNGTQQNVAALTPIPGVVFNIAPVNGVDLTTQAGWITASTLTVNSSGQVVGGATTYTTGTATPLAATNSSGVTTYSTSTPAVYEVTEVSAPAGTVIGAPFLVTLPLPQGNNWLTNVFVYPKNTVQNAPVKTVTDTSASGVGATVNWTITSTVPNQAAGNAFTAYTIADTLDTRLTPPTAAAVTVTMKSATGTTITLPAADYTITVSGQTVTVNFTAAGLTFLTSNPSAVITVGIPTVVNSVGNGTIPNTASQFINAPTGGSTTTPSNTANTTWGDVTLHKVDPAGNALAGASFQVFTSLANAQSLTNPVSVGGVTTFTSNASGTVAINGLKAQNNGTGANLTYYIVETQAPAGFMIAPAFQQSSGGFAETVAPGTSANATVTVTDPQVSPIALPLTGSTGTAIFLGGGLALAAAGIAAAVLLVRRRQAETGWVAVPEEATGR